MTTTNPKLVVNYILEMAKIIMYIYYNDIIDVSILNVNFVYIDVKYIRHAQDETSFVLKTTFLEYNLVKKQEIAI